MSESLDRSYINMLSSELPLFTWESDTVCRFRCIICGDSQKKANKRRGHFYYDAEIDAYRHKCHNCSEASGWDLGQWLRVYSPHLYKSYQVDTFQEVRNNSGGYIALKKKKEEPKKVDSSLRRTKSLVMKKSKVIATDPALENHCVPVSELAEDHYCVKYLEARKLPKSRWPLLYFTENFRDFAQSIEPDNLESAERSPQDPRLVIPFFNATGHMTMAQGRSFDPKSGLRYITIKREEKTTKCYGLERVDFDRVKLVVEGPLDSLFLPNCLASADADLLKVKGDIYIPDNQPRNREIVKRIEKMVAQGVKVCLLPSSLDKYGKDINEYIVNGVTSNELLRIIAMNTFDGLKAKLELAKWRKI